MRTPQVIPIISTFGGKSLTLKNNAAVTYADWSSNQSRNAGPLAIKSGAGSILTVNDLRLESYGAQAMIKHDFASAGEFTLAGNMTLVTGTNRIVTLPGATQVTFNIKSNISGSGALWLDNYDGAGASNLFVLGGNNSYTGVTWLTGGPSYATNVSLRLDSDTALGNTSAVILDSSGAMLDLNGHNANLGALSGTFATSRVTNRAAGTTAIATVNVASGSTTYAGVLNNGAGALALTKSGDGTLILTGVGSNSYSGATTINGGELRVNGNFAAATGAVTVNTGGMLSGSGTLGGAVTVQNGATLIGRAGSSLTMGALTLNNTSIIDVTLGAPSASALFNVNGNLTLDGTLNITDIGGFGAGLYRIINYTGSLTDNGLLIGTIPAGFDYMMMSIDTSVANQINLAYGAADYWIGGAGTWDATTSNWTNYSGGAPHVWGNDFAVFRGTAGQVTVNGSVTFNGMQFASDGYEITGGTLNTGASVATIRVGDGTEAGAVITATISSAIAGTGGIEKNDYGTLVFAGANTYAGATTVRNGKLFINGNQSAATGAITVKNGATLGGTGITGGIVTIENGGILTGRDGDTFTMSGLVMNNSSRLAVSLGAPNNANELFKVNGDLTLDGYLDVVDIGGFGAGLYKIINYTGSLTDNGLLIGNSTVPGAEALLSIDTTTANQVNVIYAAANLWQGGDGIWSAAPGDANWTIEGTPASQWSTGYALFSSPSGTVTVSNAAGAVAITGAQFAADGYEVAEGSLTISNSNTVIRVGDGSAGSGTWNATISSAITGAGGLEKSDYGTLILAGDNSYSGDTVVKTGMLLINGDQTAAAGSVIVNAGAALGGSGIIGGVVTIEDDGILSGRSGETLTMGGLILGESSHISANLGAPTATTLFQVNGDLTLDGLLDINDAGGLGAGLYRLFEYTGLLTDNGLEFGNLPAGAENAGSLLTIDTTVGGQVSLIYGTADFWKGGSGMWDTTGTNWKSSAGGAIDKTWGGSFAIFAGTPGTVTVNATTPDDIKFNGMQFVTSGYIIDGNIVVATVDPTIIRVGDGSESGTSTIATINAEISGTGGIDKTDKGTLIISGNNTYTGPTRILDGAIRLESRIGHAAGNISNATIHSGARLLGNGGVRGNLVNHGLLAPDATDGATINITGNYTQSSTGTLALTMTTASVFSSIHIEGSAQLDGALVITSGTNFSWNAGQTFTILDATAGVTGTFATAEIPVSEDRPINPSINWTDMPAMLRFDILYGARDVRLSFTQLPYGELPGTYNQQILGAVIDQNIILGRTPELISALNTIYSVQGVLDALNSISPQQYERWFPQALHAIDANTRSIEDRLARPASPDTGWNLWVEAVSRNGNFAGDADLKSSDSRSVGVLVGMDRALNSNIKVGMFLSYTDDSLGSRLEGSRFLAGLYGRVNFNRAFIDGNIGGGTDRLTSTRLNLIPTYNRVDYNRMSTGNTDSNEYYGNIRFGYELALGSVQFTPYAAAQYVNWESDAFTEGGFGTDRNLRLRLRKLEGESFATRLGFTLSRPYAGKKITYLPRLNLAWRHEFEDDYRDITAELGGTPFTLRSQKPKSDGFIAGLGLDIVFTPTTTFYLGASYESDTSLKDTFDFNAGLQFRF